MQYLYIDSNIWLSLYHFSSDDLEQFGKLKDLVGKTLQLVIPEQTKNEVRRNRDAKVKDALSKFETISIQFPAFSKSYEEYSSISSQVNALKDAHKTWMKKIKDDIAKHQLPADEMIDDFFDSIPSLECSPETIHLAETRYKSGNPPGKDNKLGDAINWECLLAGIPNGNDIFFVSADKDYASPIDENQFNSFLTYEWNTKKESQIVFYKSLVGFLKDHISDIELLDEQEKNDLIDALADSYNFANTHALISKLSKYTDWSDDQKRRLFTAARDNSQVNRILTDDDLFEFFQALMSQKTSEDSILEDIKAEIYSLDLPF